MTTLLWVGGAVVLVLAAALPTLLAGRRMFATATGDALARARDLMSRLEFALDRAASDHPGRAEAERCRTLAGAALADQPDQADAARAADWATSGLAALGRTSGPARTRRRRRPS